MRYDTSVYYIRLNLAYSFFFKSVANCWILSRIGTCALFSFRLLLDPVSHLTILKQQDEKQQIPSHQASITSLYLCGIAN